MKIVQMRATRGYMFYVAVYNSRFLLSLPRITPIASPESFGSCEYRKE